MIGVDIVSLERMKPIYKDIAARCFSSRELKEMGLRKSEELKIAYAASRWAGKEAYVKASQNLTASYKDIEILNDEKGRPHLFFKQKEVGEISLADDGYSIAFVQIRENEE